MKNRHHNGQIKKDKRLNNDQKHAMHRQLQKYQHKPYVGDLTIQIQKG